MVEARSGLKSWMAFRRSLTRRRRRRSAAPPRRQRRAVGRDAPAPAGRSTFGIGSFGPTFGFRFGVGWRYVLVLRWGRRRRRIVCGELIMVGWGPLGFLDWTCGALQALRLWLCRGVRGLLAPHYDIQAANGARRRRRRWPRQRTPGKRKRRRRGRRPGGGELVNAWLCTVSSSASLSWCSLDR